MQYWYWWNLNCGLKGSVEIKFPDNGHEISLNKMQTIVYLNMPLTGGSKIHIVKGLYVLKDLMKYSEKKINMCYEEKKFKKENQIILRSLFSEKQVCFFFQAFYLKLMSLYNLRKLKLSIIENSNGLLVFTLQDMIGVTKSYDLFKWSYQLKVNIKVEKNLLKMQQSRVFFSYFVMTKV